MVFNKSFSSSFNCFVVTPGPITLATSAKVFETSKELSLINSISSCRFIIDLRHSIY